MCAEGAQSQKNSFFRIEMGAKCSNQKKIGKFQNFQLLQNFQFLRPPACDLTDLRNAEWKIKFLWPYPVLKIFILKLSPEANHAS